MSGFLLLSHPGSSEAWPGVYPNIWRWVSLGARSRALLIEWKSVGPLNYIQVIKENCSHPLISLKSSDSQFLSFPQPSWVLSTQHWNDRDSFSIEETINSFLWLMWCSEERGSRITVLSWSLIPSQQDNNNNTMISLDKQRHIYFEPGLIDNPFFWEFGHHYHFIVPMLSSEV